MSNHVYIYFIAVNILAFILYGLDKYKARNNKYRVSEFLLLLFAVLGGALGASAGMLVFKHKLSKPKFYIAVPLLMLIQEIIKYRLLVK